jgi:nicotinamide mononucleotide transporter
MFLGTSFMEWAAVLTTALCIFLAGRNNIHTWWTGIVACVLYGFVFYDAKLYADMTLQGFFIVTGFVGWWNWSLSKTFKRFSDGEKTLPLSDPLPITKTPKDTWIKYGLFAGVVTLGYGYLLHRFTDAAAPLIDSTVLTLSVVAQLMLMKRRLENWSVWTVVNLISVPLYFSRSLYLSAGLYAFCLVNAVISWRHWLDLFDEQNDSVKKAEKLIASESEAWSRT